MSFSDFLSRFQFHPELRGYSGIEREFFLAGPDGRLVPQSPRFLKTVDDVAWTYELSACQVEHRTDPCRGLDDLREQLRAGTELGQVTAECLGMRLLVSEVGPEDMTLDVYPDVRYLRIVETLPLSILRAACRVAGLHIHLGVSNMDEAIRVYNAGIEAVDRLIRLGDHSSGLRFDLYRQMATQWMPNRYESPQHFYTIACERGFADNPRNCWDLIRITRHGTVEFRMFGMTSSLDEILGWVAEIREFL